MIVFIIATLAFSAYAVPIHLVSERCSVTLTLLLTTVAFKLVLVEGMPKVSYLTFLDQYVVTSFFLIFIITLQNVVTASIFGVKNTVTDTALNVNFWWYGRTHTRTHAHMHSIEHLRTSRTSILSLSLLPPIHTRTPSLSIKKGVTEHPYR